MSVTCCPLDSGDDFPPSFHQVTLPIARKEHRCYECNRVIARGERYEKAVGCWDGRFDVFKTCILCAEIRAHFACNGFLYGQLWDDLGDNFLPTMTAGGPCMEGLSPAAKSRLFDEKLKSLGLLDD